MKLRANHEELFFIKNQNLKFQYENCKKINQTFECENMLSSNNTDFNLSFNERQYYFKIYTSKILKSFLIKIFNNNLNLLVLTVLSALIVLVRSFIFYLIAYLIAKKFHKNMLAAIIQAKIRFFDLNPIGRIINRFSKDIGNLDDALPVSLFDFLQVSII